MKIRNFVATIAAFGALFGFAALSQEVKPLTNQFYADYDWTRPEADFIKRKEMIPMRDGVKLCTIIVMKKGTMNGPILMSRTPYNARKTTARNVSQKITEILPVMDTEFVNDNYIRVYQDIRGRGCSEGDFIINRPIMGPLNDTKTDETTDTYDTIDWLVKNIKESNGKVGIIGSSYVGFTALVATLSPHPALKAAVPQSPMVDGWIGDDWFHNGAFRMNSFDFIPFISTDRGDNDDVPFGNGDEYLKYGAVWSAGDFAKKWGIDKYPIIQEWFKNPNYSKFWSLQAVDKWFANAQLKVPTMLVVGAWDQEDSYGATKMYEVLEPKDKNNDMVSLVIGPWRHSQVNYEARNLGALELKGDTAKEFRIKYLKPFFDYHLKGGKNPNTPPVLTYAVGADVWNHSQKWPIGKETKIYLNSNDTVSFEMPKNDGTVEYVSDPKKPIPFVKRPIYMRDANIWKPWLVSDQRFMTDRTDVAVFESAVLDKEVHIMGAPMVNLFASTTGTDGDFVVKLIDVYPDEDTYDPEMAGYQLPVGLEIFRGRYVDSFEKPRALKAGIVENFKFGLPNVDYVFKPGHKIMVQVQSTLFPLYDRNPQKYVENIFFAKPEDYQKATIKIHTGPKTPTSISLPIVD